MTERKELLSDKILKRLYFEEVISCTKLSTGIVNSFPFTTIFKDELKFDVNAFENGDSLSIGRMTRLMYALQDNVTYVVTVAMDAFVSKIAITDKETNFVAPIQHIIFRLSGGKRRILNGYYLEAANRFA